jgi:hypothetical protein
VEPARLSDRSDRVDVDLRPPLRLETLSFRKTRRATVGGLEDRSSNLQSSPRWILNTAGEGVEKVVQPRKD